MRECPDARENCSTTFGTEQCLSSSGCVGGTTGCAPGLIGVYCELCDRSGDTLIGGRVYYVKSDDGEVAREHTV